jgi:tetratricopeptide (TPR) repeat protein
MPFPPTWAGRRFRGVQALPAAHAHGRSSSVVVLSVLGLGVTLGLGLAMPALARANDFDQFQSAREAYESLNYDHAADLFRGLVADAMPFDRRPLVLESRKYLAAAYMFLRRYSDAEAQFELLLQADHDYVLDPLAFPDEVVAKFNEVKARVSEERARSEQQRTEREAQERVQSELVDRQQKQRLGRLYALAGTQTIEQRNSRWVAFMPFGAGQFQNGDSGLGLLLAVSQAVLLSTTVVTFVLHESLRDEPAPAVPEDARLAESAFRITNQVSFGLFMAVAVAGVVDAQVRYKPSRTYERPRALPPDLLELELSLQPSGVNLSGRF